MAWWKLWKSSFSTLILAFISNFSQLMAQKNATESRTCHWVELVGVSKFGQMSHADHQRQHQGQHQRQLQGQNLGQHQGQLKGHL